MECIEFPVNTIRKNTAVDRIVSNINQLLFMKKYANRTYLDNEQSLIAP